MNLPDMIALANRVTVALANTDRPEDGDACWHCQASWEGTTIFGTMPTMTTMIERVWFDGEHLRRERIPVAASWGLRTHPYPQPPTIAEIIEGGPARQAGDPEDMRAQDHVEGRSRR